MSLSSSKPPSPYKMLLTVEPRKSIIELAEESGLFDINASDLVCESSANGICYYDFVLSSHIASSSDGGTKLYLAKFDGKVNLEYFEMAHIPNELFEDGLPQTDIALMTLGILTWKHLIAKSRVLCLVRNMDGDCSQALEALKRATHKFSCLHHVQATGRRNSTSSTSSHGSSQSVLNEGMKMRVMLCQTRNVVDHIPTQAIRETKALLNPSSNPILCICFPIS
ncbi:unnamed protein product [Caenorhabditis auriculariae]|uniref:Uncharacterized protein n=1 Tax=Caenorhabditis auriculariae TaxID=2777116 RepID=A0A8S1H4A1_9PELO|nr:unnamed protein product [Caenorhabditis auriculariae]